MKKRPSFRLMRQSLIAAVFSVAVFSPSCKSHHVAKQGNAVITGKFTNSKNDTLFFINVSKKPFQVLDSVVTDGDGSFALHPTIPYKGFYNVVVGRNGQQFAAFIAGPADSLVLTGDAKNLGYTWKIEGSTDAKRFETLNEFMTKIEKRKAPFKDKLDSMLNVFQTLASMLGNDTSKVDSLDKIYMPVWDSTRAQLSKLDSEGEVFARKFVDEDPSSFSNIAAFNLLDPYENFSYYEKTVVALEKKYPDNPNVKIMRDFIERKRTFCKGQLTDDITLPDPDGKILKLSSLRGNVVLIDFWASWCGPCMAELPTVVADYKKFHDKGFEVFSVSLDTDKKSWTDAIKKKGLVWKWQVMDQQDPNNSFAVKYGVKTIPRLLLLDRDGKLVDRDVMGDELEKKLTALFASETSVK